MALALETLEGVRSESAAKDAKIAAKDAKIVALRGALLEIRKTAGLIGERGMRDPAIFSVAHEALKGGVK